MAELVGVGMFGFIIGNIASLIANLDSAKAQHRGKMEAVGASIRERGLPRHLARRMTAYYDYLWETRRGSGGEELLDELPAALRTEVALYLNRELIEQVPLFEGASGHFVEDLVLRLKARIALPGEYIIRTGEHGREMYFISRGSVEVVTADGNTVLAHLGAGQFFGEMALILEAPCSASIRAVGYCDLYSLSKSDFEEVLALYPAFAQSIRAQAEERKKRNLQGREG